MRKIITRIVVIIFMFVGGVQGYQMQIPVGETMEGVVTHVIDGDTLRLNGTKIRLWGIDAPERDMDYYHHATDFLAQQAAWKTISCTVRQKPSYDRVVAQCKRRSDDADLGALLVKNGWAKDYTRHSRRYYLPQEITAKKAEKGIWQK